MQQALACFQREGSAEDFEAVMYDVLPLLVDCASASCAALDCFTRLMGQVSLHCNPREAITLVLALLDEAARYVGTCCADILLVSLPSLAWSCSAQGVPRGMPGQMPSFGAGCMQRSWVAFLLLWRACTGAMMHSCMTAWRLSRRLSAGCLTAVSPHHLRQNSRFTKARSRALPWPAPCPHLLQKTWHIALRGQR